MDVFKKSVLRPPDTIYLMFLCVTSGAIQFLGALNDNPAMERLLPLWVTLLWGLLLFIGAAVTLIGVLWSDKQQPKGMLIEAAGRWILWPISWAYCVALYAFAGTFSPSIIFVFGFGITCIVRIRFITKLIKEWRALNGSLRGT